MWQTMCAYMFLFYNNSFNVMKQSVSAVFVMLFYIYMKEKKPRNPYWEEKMGFWKRLGWVLTYYRLPILIAAGVLIVAGYILYINLRPHREDILNVMIVNGNTVAESDVFDRYLGEAGFDLTEYESYVSNGIQIRMDGTDEHASSQVVESIMEVV